MLDFGTLKFVVWNRTPNELTDAKWKATDLQVEAPAPLFVERETQPVVVSSHYSKFIVRMSHKIKSLWVSYRIEPDHSSRICIYGKLQFDKIQVTTPKFNYAVYMSNSGDCDKDSKSTDTSIFSNANVQNGYSNSDLSKCGVSGKSAFTMNGRDYVLNVYILGFDAEMLKMQEPTQLIIQV